VKKTKQKRRPKAKSKKHSEAELKRLRKRYGIQTMKTAKIEAMKKAIAAVEGDRILAAALLGIGKTSLYRGCPV
jgi:transcriptional regulator with PAS, ATPase and Fis domain